MSKIDQAVEIVRENPSASRKDLIARFVKELGMTPAGASTYVANARKKVNGVAVVTKTKKVKKAEKVDKRSKTAKAAKKARGQQQIVDDAFKMLDNEIETERKFKKQVREGFTLVRPEDHPLDDHIIDVVIAMTDKQKQAKIAKMVDLCEMLEG